MIDISTYLTLVETESKKDKLETIYNEYLSVMTYVARDLVGKYNAAEDVVHNAILKIIDNLDKIDLTKATATKSFVRIITRSCAIDWLRKEKPGSVVSAEEMLADTESSEPMPIEYVMSNEGYEHLVSCIMSLSPSLKDACELKYICGFSNKEIADMLRITENNVGVRINRAKAILSKKMKEGANG